MNVQEIALSLKIGKRAGDLLHLPLKALQMPVDVLIAGPPCPPWAGNGNKMSLKDARAAVFVQIMAGLTVHFKKFFAYFGPALL